MFVLSFVDIISEHLIAIAFLQMTCSILWYMSDELSMKLNSCYYNCDILSFIDCNFLYLHFSNWSGRLKQLILKQIQVIGWPLDPVKLPIVLFRRLYLERWGKEANPLGWQNATNLEFKHQAQILVNIIFQTLFSRVLFLSFWQCIQIRWSNILVAN